MIRLMMIIVMILITYKWRDGVESIMLIMHDNDILC